MLGSEDITNIQEPSVTAPASSSKLAPLAKHAISHTEPRTLQKPFLITCQLAMETLIGHCAPGAGSRPSTVLAESCPILRGNLCSPFSPSKRFKKQARIGQICLSALVGDKTGSLPNLGEMLPCSTEAVRKTKHPFKQGFFMVILEEK